MDSNNNIDKPINKKTNEKKAKETVSLFSLWRYASIPERLLVLYDYYYTILTIIISIIILLIIVIIDRLACLLSMGIGALQPVTIIITGDVLNGGAATNTFTLSPSEVAKQLDESGFDLLGILIIIIDYY